MDSPTLHNSQRVTRSMSMAQKLILDKKSTLESLPTELLDTVTSHLDPVNLLCLKSTSRYFHASIPKPKLSHCARLEIIHYLNLDRPRSSKMHTPKFEIPRCAGYSKTRPWKDRTYCNACRANGHMEYCCECGVRTCVRRSDYRWKKWMDEEKERKERKERKAAQALVAAQQEKQTRNSTKGKERGKVQAPSAPETHMPAHGPAVRVRSDGRDMEGKDSEHRDERLARDPSRKGWGTQGIVFEMPVIEELSINADEEMADGMDDEEKEQ